MNGKDIKFGCHNLYNLLSGNWKSAEINQKPDSKATGADLKAYIASKGTTGEYVEGKDENGPFLFAKNGHRYMRGSGKQSTKTGFCAILAKDYRKFVDEYMAKDVIMRDPADFDDIPTSSKRMIRERIRTYLLKIKKVVITDEMQKGHDCESQSMGMIQDYFNGAVFIDTNGEKQFEVENDYLIGHMDAKPFLYNGEQCALDVKNKFNNLTWFATQDDQIDKPEGARIINEPYYSQTQAYAWMTGSDIAMIAYTLNETSAAIIESQCKKLFYKMKRVEDFYESFELFKEWIYTELAGGADSNIDDVDDSLVDLFKNWRQTHRNHDITVVPEKDRVLILRDEACKDWQGLAEWKLKRAQVYAHWVLEHLMGIEVEPMDGAVESPAELPF